MKTLILFVFFASLFYYLKPSTRPVVVDLDEIRVKVSAPKRVNEPRTHRHITRAPADNAEIVDDAVTEAAKELIETNTNIEEGWEVQLKNRLIELDPLTGEEIYKNYQDEKAQYAQNLELLVKDHEESVDLEHLIDELDDAHQQKLQDIFGPFYEDLRELQAPVNQ